MKRIQREILKKYLFETVCVEGTFVKTKDGRSLLKNVAVWKGDEDSTRIDHVWIDAELPGVSIGDLVSFHGEVYYYSKGRKSFSYSIKPK